MQTLPKTLSIDTHAGTITLPFRGALYLAHQIGPGTDRALLPALSVVGMADAAMDYLAARRYADKLADQINALNAESADAGGDGFLSDCAAAAGLRPKLDEEAVRADECWRPIQALIDACKRAVETTDYDGAPA